VKIEVLNDEAWRGVEYNIEQITEDCGSIHYSYKVLNNLDEVIDACSGYKSYTEAREKARNFIEVQAHDSSGSVKRHIISVGVTRVYNVEVNSNDEDFALEYVTEVFAANPIDEALEITDARYQGYIDESPFIQYEGEA